ncbi:MAG: helix-turn-helix transcriptional regulator [Hyphomicrobiaceae bacterium]|nr:helix-turn-helix transcriptional regulator [Hyphomicrobiaceae bacterium]
MPELAGEYLTTREVAELLRIKERKVYDLATSGDIPCTRALGKLLFQRTALDAWLARHGSGDMGAPAVFPTVFLGSHDPLLEWALRESGSGAATYFDGSLDGLDRFADAAGIATGLHIFDRETGAWNVPTISQRFLGKPVVLVEWAWRERGLIVQPDNPKKFGKIADLKGTRIVPRQAQAGSQVLLAHLLKDAGLDGAVKYTHAARTETDAALAVLDGQADAAFGLLSVAKQYRLDFIPVIRERFDLLVWRSEWFEDPFQKFLELCRSPLLAERVTTLEGYDISGFGKVHFNGK